MFTISDTRPARNCEGFTRRDFLQVGGLGIGSLTLADLLAAGAQAASKPLFRDKSVIFLFLQGGPPHIEMFDPKMTAPSEFRSITGEVKTKLPGITFGGTSSQMAKIADKLAVVRSYGSGNAGHTYQKVASGDNKTQATMGAIYARIRGSNHPQSGMPTNVLVLPEAIDPKIEIGKNFETNALPTLTDRGEFGKNYAAFNPIGGGELQRNMELKIERKRFDDRRALLKKLDAVRRRADSPTFFAEGTDEYKRQAFEIITRGVADAFDLSQEDPKTIAKYDTSHIFKQEEVQRWYDMKRASNLLGRQLLLARRLCERGCGFVTVSDCGWDFHSNNNSPKNLGGMYWLGPQVDHAVAAFVQDVEDRGLTDKILLVITGEMGRTPRINKNGGRNHYGNLTSLAFAGGGLKMGQVIGQSDAYATKPATKPYAPKHMLATIMHTLFDVGELRVAQRVPRALTQAITECEPIDGLL